MTIETIQVLYNRLHDKVAREDIGGQEMWVIPAMFCPVQYINDGLHWPPENVVEHYFVQRVWNENVEFCDVRYLDQYYFKSA